MRWLRSLEVILPLLSSLQEKRLKHWIGTSAACLLLSIAPLLAQTGNVQHGVMYCVATRACLSVVVSGVGPLVDPLAYPGHPPQLSTMSVEMVGGGRTISVS